MATLRGRWLVPILMTGMCLSFQGPPARPSTPECHIPCDDEGCGADIICTWDSKPDLNNSVTYTLYWNSSVSSSSSTSHSGIIQRSQFTSDSEMQVWVQAQNQHGVAKSEPYVFNPVNIYKPPPPDVTTSSQDPIEISWSTFCDQFAAGDCEVRYRTEAEEAWIQPDEGGVSGSYMLEDPQPNTNYLFQVRCNCSPGLMSNWSKVHTIRSAERAPVGKLDVWTDCGILPTSSDCVLTWKKLPMFQARGRILGYNVVLFYKNGTNMPLNTSAAEPVGLFDCGEVQCYLNTSLKEVTSVSISAYNAINVTAPSHLDMPERVKMPNETSLHLEMKENNFTVSWPSWISDNITEYVVQYKQADSLLGIGFDWVRVNKSQAIITIKGQFKKKTAYQVSVFTVSDQKKEPFFLSDIAHFVQGEPAKVPLFKVLSYGTTYVTVLWEPVLLSKQNGVTPYYLIGGDRQKVYNVSAYPQLRNRTFNLTNLTEDQDYELWIQAVNQAGPGPNTTVRVKTQPNENIGPLSVLLGILVIIIIIIIIFFCIFFSRENKACPFVPSFFNEKVPDPHNSNIIKQMKHQMNDSLAWICIPALEQQPIISVIEIVDVPPCALNSQFDKITTFARLSEDRGGAQEELLSEECNKTLHRNGKQEYSKMVDSDEETNREDQELVDNSWSSEDENFSSGYERHFMPTISEIMKV